MIKDNDIYPLTRQDFVKIVTDNLAIQDKPCRYAWLRVTYAREYIVCKERGDIPSCGTPTAWGWWVIQGFKAAIREDFTKSRKAATELRTLAKNEDD